jgi:hypothetical protein
MADRPGLVGELVSMPVAAALAYIRITGRNEKLSDAQMETMAAELARLITVYAVDDTQKSVRALGPDDTQGGRFRQAGKRVEFTDGRDAITGLAVTRTSLDKAIEALKRK